MPNSAPESSDAPAKPRSRAAAWALTAGGVVVIVVIALASGSGTAGDGGVDRGAGGGDRRAAAAMAGGGTAAPNPDPADSVGGSSESPTPSIGDPAETPARAEAGVAAGVEVLPLGQEEVGLPASEALPELLQDSAPAAAAATGRRVAGLPDVISPAPESTLTSTAVGVTDQTVTASLAATTSAAGMAILDHYVRVFGAVGLSGTPATTADGNTVQTFYRGNDSVTVTIADASGGVIAYTLRGLFFVSA